MTTESSACNFLQLNFLDPQTWILGAIGCKDNLKAMIYRDSITSLSDLKEGIESHVHNIPQFMLLSKIEHAIVQ